MGARELFAAGMSGGPVRSSVDDAGGGGAALSARAFQVTLTGVLAGLFEAPRGASGPRDKPHLKARSSAAISDAVTALRRAFLPQFDCRAAATGAPVRFARGIGLPSA